MASMSTYFADIPTLALYKRVKPITSIDALGAWVIRAWTRSPYSHCEIVIGDMWYSSSIQDGCRVRAKQIEYDPDHWDLIPLPWANPQSIIDFFEQTDGQPYGWADLFIQQALRLHIDGHGWICSGWCATALDLSGGDDWFPRQLGDVCRWRAA